MKRYWIAGIALASLGVLLARLSPHFLTQPAYKLAAYAGGVTLALAGLGVLIMGIGRKAKRESGDDQPKE